MQVARFCGHSKDFHWFDVTIIFRLPVLFPVFLPVLLGRVVGGKGPVVGFVEQKVLQLLVMVQGALQLLQSKKTEFWLRQIFMQF